MSRFSERSSATSSVCADRFRSGTFDFAQPFSQDSRRRGSRRSEAVGGSHWSPRREQHSREVLSRSGPRRSKRDEVATNSGTGGVLQELSNRRHCTSQRWRMGNAESRLFRARERTHHLLWCLHGVFFFCETRLTTSQLHHSQQVAEITQHFLHGRNSPVHPARKGLSKTTGCCACQQTSPTMEPSRTYTRLKQHWGKGAQELANFFGPTSSHLRSEDHKAGSAISSRKLRVSSRLVPSCSSQCHSVDAVSLRPRRAITSEGGHKRCVYGELGPTKQRKSVGDDLQPAVSIRSLGTRSMSRPNCSKRSTFWSRSAKLSDPVQTKLEFTKIQTSGRGKVVYLWRTFLLPTTNVQDLEGGSATEIAVSAMP